MHRLSQESVSFTFTGAAALALVAAVSWAWFPPAGGIARSDAAHASRIPDAEIAAGVSLTHLHKADRALASKVVQTTMGEEVGRVISVSLQSDGTPKSVRVSLSKTLDASRHTVRIDVENLLYLTGRDVLVTRFTKAETAELLGNGNAAN